MMHFKQLNRVRLWMCTLRASKLKEKAEHKCLNPGAGEAGARGPEPPPGRKRPPQPRLLGAAQRLLGPPPPPSPCGNAFLPGRVSRARGGGRRPEAGAGTKERRARGRRGPAPGPAWCRGVPVCCGRGEGVQRASRSALEKRPDRP